MIPLTTLAVINSATRIAFILAASIIAWLPNRPACAGLLEQEALRRHRFSFLRHYLRLPTESSPTLDACRSNRSRRGRPISGRIAVEADAPSPLKCAIESRACSDCKTIPVFRAARRGTENVGGWKLENHHEHAAGGARGNAGAEVVGRDPDRHPGRRGRFGRDLRRHGKRRRCRLEGLDHQSDAADAGVRRQSRWRRHGRRHDHQSNGKFSVQRCPGVTLTVSRPPSYKRTTDPAADPAAGFFIIARSACDEEFGERYAERLDCLAGFTLPRVGRTRWRAMTAGPFVSVLHL